MPIVKTLLLFSMLISYSYSIEKGYPLKGKALLEFSIFKFDIYEIAYYEKSKNDFIITLDYKRDIKREHSLEGWKVGLEKNLKELDSYREQIDWIKAHTKSVKKGDLYKIKVLEDTVTFFLNENVIGKKKDAKLASIVHLPWLGRNPVDEEIKKRLLSSTD